MEAFFFFMYDLFMEISIQEYMFRSSHRYEVRGLQYAYNNAWDSQMVKIHKTPKCFPNQTDN